MPFEMDSTISIHAPPARGATADCPADHSASPISIHAPPREGGDGRPIQWSDAKRSISIHAPCEGGDLPAAIHVILQTRFQSTPPARGATVYHVISIRVVVISIHAPREGGDGQNGGGGLMAANFNPRPPRGGRRLLYWYDLCLS